MLMVQPRFNQINVKTKTQKNKQTSYTTNQSNNISFGKRILNDENFILLNKIIALGKKWIETKIPPIYDLKAGAVVDCGEGLSLVGGKFHNTLLSRDSSNLKVSADISGENQWFEIEDKSKGIKCSHFWSATTNSHDKHYACRIGRDGFMNMISDNMGTSEQREEMQQLSKRGLTFLLTGEDKA